MKRSAVTLTLLATVFTLALTFATVEAPRVINSVLRAYFPDIHPIVEPELCKEFTRYVRPLGYACLLVVTALIIVGFTTERRSLSSLGSIAFFLPTFGYFAASMFFLAGVGILRVLWLPFWDSSPILLKLGDIVYLPFMILTYTSGLMKLYIGTTLAILVVGSGLLIFFLGTITWFYGKFEGIEILDFWIYRYSRHPQYLGFLVWSYGVLLLATLSPVPFGGYNPGPSFPWLISSLIVFGVALTEEIEMTERYDERYLKYQGSAPFMLPLPKFISTTITAPTRILFKRNLPKSGKEVIYTLAVYCVILSLLSVPFLILNWRW